MSCICQNIKQVQILISYSTTTKNSEDHVRKQLHMWIDVACVMSLLAGAGLAQDYAPGAAEAANTFKQTALGSGGMYNHLALLDHVGPSGVPLGGIGVGCFDLAPDGRITRVALNNTHEDGVIKDVKGGFFALYQKSNWRTQAVRLVRDGKTVYGLNSSPHTIYRGLFPTVNLRASEVTVKAWSGLVPHNIKDSSLPVAFFELTMVNCERADQDISLAFSWEDVIGRQIFDLDSGAVAAATDIYKVNGSTWKVQPRVDTVVEPYSVGGWQGLRQRALEPLRARKATYQNLVSEVALLAEPQEGMTVSILPAYDVNAGDDAWQAFREEGQFKGEFNKPVQLFDKTASRNMASAIAIRTQLKMGEKKTVRFMLAWYHPEFMPDRTTPGAAWGTADYGRYYHNYFASMDGLVEYARQNRDRIHDGTTGWQEPILDSTYPDWLKFKLINCGYVIYANTILNKAGDFTIMEGGMGGLAGTMDQRNSTYAYYQKLFPELDRSERRLFAAGQHKDGAIPHFDGHYYHGLNSRDGKYPLENSSYLDNTTGWMLQLVSDYRLTGDISELKANADKFKLTLRHLRAKIGLDNPTGIPIGGTTFEDDFCHPPVYAYTGPVYLCALKAGEVVAEALGDQEMLKECRTQAAITRHGLIKYLWNGRFFSMACEKDGSKALANWLFSSQLAGQFLSRYIFSEDVLSQDILDAFLTAMGRTALSASPAYYTDKIFDVDLMTGVDEIGSRCWGFYLESYTAMLAIQAGYLNDGLTLMKSIQDVHLRKGWTWTQNLWNPGELTYMTAPVTWFITDILAGSNLDVPAKALYLAPIIDRDSRKVIYPIYFPKFWATLNCDAETQMAEFRVTRTFELKDDEIVIDTIHIVPSGVAASECRSISIPPLTIKEGAVLDLSKHWDVLTKWNSKRSILASPGTTPDMTVAPAVAEIVCDANPFDESARVKLLSPRPDSVIYYTLDGSDPMTGNGSRYRGEFEVKESCIVQSRLKLKDGSWGMVVGMQLTRREYLQPDATGQNAGLLTYNCYEGQWSTLPDFNRLTPVRTGQIKNIDLKVASSVKDYGLVFEGVLVVPVKGIYTFCLTSDDGSRLTIGGAKLNNDGIHGPEPEQSMILPMESGQYRIRLEYFQNAGGQALSLNWKSRDMSLRPVF